MVADIVRAEALEVAGVKEPVPYLLIAIGSGISAVGSVTREVATGSLLNETVVANR
jgi:hypothetical protein